MKSSNKKETKKKDSKPQDAVKPKKLSKAGKAMRDGIGRGNIIELTEDPWNLK